MARHLNTVQQIVHTAAGRDVHLCHHVFLPFVIMWQVFQSLTGWFYIPIRNYQWGTLWGQALTNCTSDATAPSWWNKKKNTKWNMVQHKRVITVQKSFLCSSSMLSVWFVFWTTVFANIRRDWGFRNIQWFCTVKNISPGHSIARKVTNTLQLPDTQKRTTHPANVDGVLFISVSFFVCLYHAFARQHAGSCPCCYWSWSSIKMKGTDSM